MTQTTANGLPLIRATIHEAIGQNWVADVEVDALENLTGAMVLDVLGVGFSGTIFRGGIEAGRWRGRIVGGAGGLSSTVVAKNYVNTNLAGAIGDLFSAVGETLDAANSDPDALAGELTRWHRTTGTAGQALDRLVSSAGTFARMQRDGTVKVGAESFDALELGDAVIVEDRTEAGTAVLAPLSPVALPGVAINGRNVSSVVTRLAPGSLRQELSFQDEPSDGGRLVNRLRAVVNSLLGRRLDYFAMYPCTVTSQAGQQLELLPDDDRVKGSGVGSVPIKMGFPGYSVNVPAGSRVLLGWEAGDPKRPYCTMWESGTGVSAITFDGGTQSIARVGDTVAADSSADAWALVVETAINALAPGTFTLANNFASTVSANMGDIATGNDKLKA